MAIAQATTSETTASSTVTGNFKSNVSSTGRPSRTERPRSPCKRWVSQIKYRMTSGRSSPRSLRKASSAVLLTSSPSMMRAGSPGMSAISEKTMRLTKNSTGSVRRRRRTRYRLIATVVLRGRTSLPPPPELRGQTGGAEPHHAVGVVHESLQFGAEHLVLLRPPQEHVRHVVGENVHGLRVRAFALVRTREDARGVQQRVDARIAVAGVVEAAARDNMGVDVAVRVRSAAPAQQHGLKLVSVELAEQGAELHELDIHLDPPVCGHRLNDLGHLLADAGRRDLQGEREPVGHAPVLQLLAHQVQIALGDARIDRDTVGKHCRWEWPVGRIGGVPEDDFYNRAPIDGGVERLAEKFVVKRRAGEVQVNPLKFQTAALQQAERWIRPEFGYFGGPDLIDDVQLSGAEVCQTHVFVGERAINDALDVGRGAVPMPVEPLQNDAFLRAFLHEFVWTCPDRLSRQPFA